MIFWFCMNKVCDVLLFSFAYLDKSLTLLCLSPSIDKLSLNYQSAKFHTYYSLVEIWNGSFNQNMIIYMWIEYEHQTLKSKGTNCMYQIRSKPDMSVKLYIPQSELWGHLFYAVSQKFLTCCEIYDYIYLCIKPSL